MSATATILPDLTPAETAAFIAADGTNQFFINSNRRRAGLTELEPCQGCKTEVAEVVFDDIDSQGANSYNPVGGSTKDGSAFFGPVCSAKDGFSDDERARAVLVTDGIDQCTTTLGEIADANRDDLDDQVAIALRSLLNGSTEVTVTGFVGAWASYRIAKAA